MPVIDPVLIVCRRRAGWRLVANREHAADRPRRRPDLQRAREPAAARARRARARRASACWLSTMGRRTAPGRSPTRWPRVPGPDRGHAPHRASAGSGAPTSTACSRRSRSPTSISSARWTPTCRTIPEYLPALAAATADHDVVIGSRYLNGVSVVNWPLHRIFLSAFANRYIRAVTSLTPQRLHERLPVLAARVAGAPAARRAWCPTATRFSSRCCSRPAGAAAASARFRSSSSSGGRASRRCRARCSSSR